VSHPSSRNRSPHTFAHAPGRPRAPASRRAAPREASTSSGGWSGEFAEHCSAPAERAGCAKPALHERSKRGGRFILALLLALTMPAAPALAEDPPASAARNYTIAPGTLEDVLTHFAAAAGIPFSFDPALVANRRSGGINGAYTGEEGLRLLLRGSGLTVQPSSDGGYTLVKAPQAQASAAKATPPEDMTKLEAVTVSATRGGSVAGATPQKVTVIDREEIERQLQITADRGQVLGNLIPGYTPSRQKLVNSGETFRGRKVLFMVDGVPQSTPLRDDSRDGYTIDLSMVERIEVIHGASAEHGLGATGGIINYVTKQARAGEFNQRAAVHMSADDGLHSEGLGYKLDYQVSGRRGDWDYLAGATLHERGIFFDGAGRTIGVDPFGSGDIQDSTSYDLFGKLGYWLGDNQYLGFSVNRFELESNHDYANVPGDRAEGIPATSRRGDPPNDPPFNNATTVNLSYVHGDWWGNQLDTQLYHQRYRGQFGTHPTAFPYFDAAGNKRLDHSRTESDKVGGKFTLSREGLFNGHLKLTTGIDLVQDSTQQVLVQTGRTYVPESVLRNAAAFLQGDIKVTDALSLHPGVRYERARIDVDTYHTLDRKNVNQDKVEVGGGSPHFSETLVKAGAIYRFTGRVQVFANYSEGFGIPDVGRVLRSISTPGQDVDSLIQLKPIVTDNRELGLRLSGNRYKFEISYYESNSDLGERLVQEGVHFTGQREKVEIRGVDVSGNLRLNDAHTLGLIYAFNEGKSDTDGDGRVDTELDGANIAPQRLTLQWQANWNERLSSFVQATRYFDKIFHDQTNPNLRRFDGYHLVDASLSYRLPAGRASFGIENLLDEKYTTWYSQTTRDGNDQFFSGRGRTFTVGYELDF